MIKWTTHIFWGQEFGRNSFVPFWWLQWSCLVTGQYFLNGPFVVSYAGPIHMSFSLHCVRSLPWLLALFYYLFMTVVSLLVWLISSGTLWVAGKVCPGQGRVAVQKVPDLPLQHQPHHWSSWLGLRAWGAARARHSRQRKGSLSQPNNVESILSDNFQLPVKPK